ncbi:MAG: ATP-dependent Clp protease proteolytic subunit [Oscillospiraceae bacterium]|jgi:ATP-dependent protease ClpP protease subunit|nr:ATP-dependent Clp protease proteolytic subunit [Oscillospiraceae bacterium]
MQREAVEEYGQTQSRPTGIYCMSIIGQIEGHQILPEETKTTKYEHILPQLAEIEQSSEISGVLFLLNTAGGDIEAGLAIAEMIAGMQKPTVSLVLGGGHSIGIPLAVSAKYTLIAPTATMTVHPVRMTGVVIGVEQTYNYFAKVQDRIVDFVTRCSRVKRLEFVRLMENVGEMAADVGTILSGAEAVKLGLVNKVGTLSDALAALNKQIDKKR